MRHGPAADTAVMRPLSAWPAAARRGIAGVFTDIDDTLTTDGAITPDALAGLGALKAAGLAVVAITGRPVGWSMAVAMGAAGAAPWPVDAVVAENGAVALVPPGVSSEISLQPTPILREQLSKRYQQDTATRAANFTRMHAVLARIEREVPGALRATDSPGRECDIAIDHSEFVHLPPAQIAAVVALMQSEGMHATVSSIHINGWYGNHDKWVGACWIVRELWGRALEQEIDRWAYVGDSTNDERMFERFGHAVAVANVERFVGALRHLPRYVTPSERGAGFAEVVAALLAAR